MEGQQVSKERNEFTADNLIALRKNVKDKNILVCGSGPNEYNRISNCSTAKQIWDSLTNAHERTSQVKRFTVSMLFTEYETLKMKDNEQLQDMITRLATVINELTSLGKILTIEEQMYKVLRILPKAKLDVKVTAIREAKDITTMTLDEMVGNLRTYEMNMKDQKKEEEIDENH